MILLSLIYVSKPIWGKTMSLQRRHEYGIVHKVIGPGARSPTSEYKVGSPIY